MLGDFNIHRGSSQLPCLYFLDQFSIMYVSCSLPYLSFPHGPVIPVGPRHYQTCTVPITQFKHPNHRFLGCQPPPRRPEAWILPPFHHYPYPPLTSYHHSLSYTSNSLASPSRHYIHPAKPPPWLNRTLHLYCACLLTSQHGRLKIYPSGCKIVESRPGTTTATW